MTIELYPQPAGCTSGVCGPLPKTRPSRPPRTPGVPERPGGFAAVALPARSS